MTTPYTLVEWCCGSSALTLHQLGARRAILPYQGGKWSLRKKLSATLENFGVQGRPSQVVLVDPGPWGRVMQVVLGAPHGARRKTIEILDAWSKEDPKARYDHLHGSVTSEDPATFAAEFLFLQRLSHSGKAVGLVQVDDDAYKWASPGLNKTSAYGTPSSARFGAVRPMIPSLVDVLIGYERDQLGAEMLFTACGDARIGIALPPTDAPRGVVVEYIDPPYASTTSYPNGKLSRAHVVELALAAQRRGSMVIVSEAEPIHELIDRGWRYNCLRSGASSGTSPFKMKGSEWITFVGASERHV